MNLISNALKFTETGYVRVCVSSRKIKSTSILLIIIVEDSGAGIPRDKFDVIFEHFSRLTPSFEGVYKGAGLGLYTVKRYIKAMNGKIEVSSELNKGTCFTVTLPFKISDHADIGKETIEQEIEDIPDEYNSAIEIKNVKKLFD